jgi:hypothetical protein
MILPFVKIPANMLAWVYRQSPLAFASSQVRAEISSGGPARDLALARMGLGSAVALAGIGAASAGLITGRGPNDPGLQRAWRAAGNQPYSVTIGGRPYSYNQLDPVGLYIGALADTVETLRYAPEESRYDIAPSLMFGLGNAMLSKTYLSGLANFFDALQDPPREGNAWIDQFLSGIAAPSAVRGLQTATDPWLRAHYELLDTIEAKFPFVAQGLPFDRDLWGTPIPAKDGFLPPVSGTGLARAVSPITYGAPAADAAPIDKWIWEHRAAFSNADTGRLSLYRPGRVQNFEVGKDLTVPHQLTPVQLDRFREQAGNGLKDNGLGARDYLDALVEGTNPDDWQQRKWNQASDELRALTVVSVVNKYRAAAKRQLLEEFPDIADAVVAKAKDLAQRRSAGRP